ncbi:MAG: membrane protein [Pararhodobacter sp.]
MSGTSIVFDPLLAWPVVVGLGVLALGVVLLAAWRGLAGWWLRALALGVAILAIANPALQTEERDPLPDIALIVTDETGSNRLAGRAEQTAEAAEDIGRELARLGIEERRVAIADAPDNRGSRLNEGLAEALADIPRDRLAGVFVVSDGLAHDEATVPVPAPVHLVQTGAPTDWDRRLIVRNAPAYGIIGETLRLIVRIEDEGAIPESLRGKPVRVGFALNGDDMQYAMAPVGQDMGLDLVLGRGGQNVLHFVLDPAEGELTGRNNEAVVQINGIRDRLRVLLVSGEPHTGQRTWRNLLKSDPSVDLVHFTILRPPDRQDGVPVNELSLIAFPTRELFIEKIDEFDLIIFDRYRRRGILPNAYFENIRRYVTEGGALLIVGGPELAGADSLYHSPLGRIMPAQPTARLYEQPFTPDLSRIGRRHPVTADLDADWPAREDGAAPGWGRWLRQIELSPGSGEVVMTGIGERPLLVLDHAGEGRIAVLASDQAWLWDRGFEGGGPQAELLRRLAHWMMAEPDLEEEALVAEAQGLTMSVTRRSLLDGPHDVTITRPDGSEVTLALTEAAPGRFVATWQGDEPGLYRLRSGEFETVAVLGTANPREYERVVADAAPMQALLSATRGGVALAGSAPALRAVDAGRQAWGRGWLGVTPREALVTTDLRLAPLLPAWGWLLLVASLILGAWLREGRR